jgi:hypothetical protein
MDTDREFFEKILGIGKDWKVGGVEPKRGEWGG